MCPSRRATCLGIGTGAQCSLGVGIGTSVYCI